MIVIENTPNPNALKFIPKQFSIDKTYRFTSIKEAERSTLAYRIFNLDGIAEVFFGMDFISITVQDVKFWPQIRPVIIAYITEYLASEMPIISKDYQESSDVKITDSSDYDGQEAELVEQIIDVINDRVRPAVAMDGGDIQFCYYKDSIVYLQLSGACAGCPSADITLKQGIERMLMYYFPEIQGVEQVLE